MNRPTRNRALLLVAIEDKVQQLGYAILRVFTDQRALA